MHRVLIAEKNRLLREMLTRALKTVPYLEIVYPTRPPEHWSEEIEQFDEDDEVDDLFNKSYRSIVNVMVSNPASIDDASFLLWVVHNLERFADRTVNICERTLFIISGEMMEMDHTDDEIPLKEE